MPVSGTISNAVIKITLDGIARVQAQLSEVRKSLATTADTTQRIGQAAGSAFSQATGSIRSLVAAADPYGFLRFEIAITRVAIQLGRTFIPLLHETTKTLTRFADWLASLSDETRETVLQFTKWALAITGVLAVAGKLVGVVASLAGGLSLLVSVAGGVLSTLWKVLGLLTPWGRLAVVIIGAGAALLKLADHLGYTEDVTGRVVSFIKDAWESVVAVVQAVADALAPVLVGMWEPVREAATSALAVLVPLFNDTFGRITAAANTLVTKLVPILSAIPDLIGRAVASVRPYVEAVFGVISKVAVTAIGLVVEAFRPLLSVINFVADLYGKIFDRLDSGGVIAFLGRIVDGFGSVMSVLSRMVSAVGPVVERLGEVFRGVFRYVSEVIDSALGRLRSLFDGTAEGAGGIAKAFTAAWDLIKDVWAALVAAFDRLQPTFEKVGAIARTVFDAIREVVESVADTLKTVFGGAIDGVVSLIGKLFDLAVTAFGAIGEKVKTLVGLVKPAVTGLINLMADAFEGLVDIVTDVFNRIWGPIKTVLKFIHDGFVVVLNAVQWAFVALVNAVVKLMNWFIGKLNDISAKIDRILENIKKVSGVEITGFGRIPEIGNMENPVKLKTWDEKIADKEAKELAGKMVADPAAARPKPADEPKKTGPNWQQYMNSMPLMRLPTAPAPREKPAEKDPNRFQGMAMVNPRFMGIAEAMRSAQQSTVPSREMAALAEINRGVNRTADATEKIAAKKDPAPPGLRP